MGLGFHASELFQFSSTGNTTDVRHGDVIREHRLLIGTALFPVGELKFKAHRSYEIPNTITMLRRSRPWHVSFNYAQEALPHHRPVDTSITKSSSVPLSIVSPG